MKTISLAIGLLILNLACSQDNTTSQKDEVITNNTNENPSKSMKTIHDFKVKDINGNEFDLASLKGKKVMIVNTASECGLTPQYENLEKLHKEYGGDKFVIIGFPCNDFGAQEPGSNEEIKTFCTKNYGVTFQMMDKVTVVGDNKCELYKWLTEEANNGVESTTVQWNFQKYLIDENGKYVKMVSPKTLPDDPEVIKWIKG